MTSKTQPPPIFSGEYSADMWKEINGARTKKQLRAALYTICCRLQELEHHIARGDYGRSPSGN